MQDKNYDIWNEVKKHTQKHREFWTIKVREIYWIKIGENIGYETNGKGNNFLRPVLIFRKFSKNTFLGIPLTTSIKDDIFHFSFSYKTNKSSCASLSQIKLFDTKRIHDKDGKINSEDFKKLKDKLKSLLQFD